jgi:hypothetical protein
MKIKKLFKEKVNQNRYYFFQQLNKIKKIVGLKKLSLTKLQMIKKSKYLNKIPLMLK